MVDSDSLKSDLQRVMFYQLSTVMNSEQIIVLEEEAVAETGHHSELLSQGLLSQFLSQFLSQRVLYARFWQQHSRFHGWSLAEPNNNDLEAL